MNIAQICPHKNTEKAKPINKNTSLACSEFNI